MNIASCHWNSQSQFCTYNLQNIKKYWAKNIQAFLSQASSPKPPEIHSLASLPSSVKPASWCWPFPSLGVSNCGEQEKQQRVGWVETRAFFSGWFKRLRHLKKIKFTEVTLVNNIYISGIQHYNSISVYSTLVSLVGLGGSVRLNKDCIALPNKLGIIF